KGRNVAVGRGVEDAEAQKRRAALFGQQGVELRLQQVAGLIGKISCQPPAFGSQFLEPFDSGREGCGRFGLHHLARGVEQQLAAGKIVPEQNEMRGRRKAQSRASSSSISPLMTSSPRCQKAGS